MTHPRLDDPDDHFPYKAEVVADLIEQDPPAGPRGPDDDSLTARDYISPAIADASEAYVAAQARHLDEQTEESRAAYNTAMETLVAARQRHRANRPDTVTITGFKGAE